MSLKSGFSHTANHNYHKNIDREKQGLSREVIKAGAVYFDRAAPIGTTFGVF